ncbi:MAG: class I SAM-dependent methyltransferase [Candidatus Eiseniibacteriota bacterium]
MTRRTLLWIAGNPEGSSAELVARLASESGIICRDPGEVARRSAEADAAVVVLASGDGTRDSLLAGCGRLVGSLGEDRVCFVRARDGGGGFPDGLFDALVVELDDGADVDRCLERIRSFVHGSSGASLGFGGTLERARRSAERALSELRGAGCDGRAEHPVVLDSAGACVSAYADALDLVQRRFWTTTVLTSGFWTHRVDAVLDANRRMMRRLAGGAGARRLFLLDRPAEQVVAAYRERRILLDRTGNAGDVAAFDEETDTLIRNVAALVAEGCELRVAFDGTAASARLPAELGWRQDDSEIAVYDDFRVDVFEGGRAGAIRRVQGFTPAMRRFPEHLQAAERFFLELWNGAAVMDDFLRDLSAALESAKGRIHYRANWLARYEFALDEGDAALKQAEAERLEEALRAHGFWGGVGSVLDVGTCTARYPLLLRPAVRDDGTIVGVDDDPDCVQFARENVARAAPGDSRIVLVRADFAARDLTLPGAPFDLVTCMMSTVSHFGRGRRADFGDPLQAVMRRFAGLLSPDGLLVLSSWSRTALESGRLLAIYDEPDCKRLVEWTPQADELDARLLAAGLRAVERSVPDPRLDLLVCRKVAA